MGTSFKIREFNGENTNAVAELVGRAFNEKLACLCKSKNATSPEFLIDMGIVHAEPFPGYLVATDEADGTPLGVLCLKWSDQQRPPDNIQWGQLLDHGLIGGLKLLIGIGLLDSPTKPGECYIEHIAVHPNAHGLGVGSALLEEGRQIALKNRHDVYSLHVAKSNTIARRLYAKHGFRNQIVLQSAISRWLYGIKEWHYMIAPLRQKILNPSEAQA